MNFVKGSGHLIVWLYLISDAVNGLVLFVDLIAHVHGQILEIPDDVSHHLQILLHLIFSCIVCYSFGNGKCQ